MQIARQNILLSHMEPSKIGSNPANANFNANASAKFECKRNLKRFLPPFYKNMLPAAAGSTFLKTNFEQSAFKNPLFGALKASNEDSLGHLFGTYGSQTFFFRPFSPSVAHPNFEKSSAKHVESAHGAVLQNDIIYHTCNFVTF